MECRGVLCLNFCAEIVVLALRKCLKQDFVKNGKHNETAMDKNIVAKEYDCKDVGPLTLLSAS